jgi:hypothetical protein
VTRSWPLLKKALGTVGHLQKSSEIVR